MSDEPVQFKIVPKEARPQGADARSAWVRALIADPEATIFLPDVDTQSAPIRGQRHQRSALSRAGRILRARNGEYDGRTGVFVWSDPRDGSG